MIPINIIPSLCYSVCQFTLIESKPIKLKFLKCITFLSFLAYDMIIGRILQLPTVSKGQSNAKLTAWVWIVLPLFHKIKKNSVTNLLSFFTKKKEYHLPIRWWLESDLKYFVDAFYVIGDLRLGLGVLAWAPTIYDWMGLNG